jgi:glycosyltransferase involved in cell wall biosynthesis
MHNSSNLEIPVLTVLLVTFNHETTVLESLNSIVTQKTKFPFILKIFDDCSSDQTLPICINHLIKINFKNYLISTSNKNNGAVINFKRALKSIDTKYFTLLEGDDYWTSDFKIETSLKIFESNLDCAIVAHNTYLINGNNNADLKYKKAKIINGYFSNGLPNNGNEIFDIFNAPYFHFSSRIYRTFPLDFEKENELIFYDLFLYYKYLSLGRVFYIDKVMSAYRYNCRGTWSSLSEYQQKYKNIHMYLEMIVYFENKYDFFYNSITGNSKLLLRIVKTDLFFYLINFSALRKIFSHMIIFYQNRFCKI